MHNVSNNGVCCKSMPQKDQMNSRDQSDWKTARLTMEKQPEEEEMRFNLNLNVLSFLTDLTERKRKFHILNCQFTC